MNELFYSWHQLKRNKNTHFHTAHVAPKWDCEKSSLFKCAASTWNPCGGKLHLSLKIEPWGGTTIRRTIFLRGRFVWGRGWRLVSGGFQNFGFCSVTKKTSCSQFIRKIYARRSWRWPARGTWLVADFSWHAARPNISAPNYLPRPTAMKNAQQIVGPVSAHFLAGAQNLWVAFPLGNFAFKKMEIWWLIATNC